MIHMNIVINPKLYETRLREEFKMMRKLQHDRAVQGVLRIAFKDRISQNLIGIDKDPITALYPEQYLINIKMPVYTSRGVLKRDWEGILTLEVNSDVLMSTSTEVVPGCRLDVSKALPFNHHISVGYFCTGGIWSVAKDFGLWYYVLGCCSIINQEVTWMDDRGAGHLNPEAYDYWKNDRKRQKVNNINWPFDLREKKDLMDDGSAKKLTIKIGQKQVQQVPKIKIIRK